jgi:hypothetical protein
MTQKKIDELAVLWEKTKNPKYKEEWYKHIKEWADGVNNSNRRSVSSSASDRRDVSKPKTVR